MDVTPPSNAMRQPQALRARSKRQHAGDDHHLLPARYDIGALQRSTFKKSTDIGRVPTFAMSAFGNSGSGHFWNSELGTTFGGHSKLGAFGPGTQSGRVTSIAFLHW